MARKKIALIGSGMIGGTLAHLASLKELAISSSSILLTASRRARVWILPSPARSKASMQSSPALPIMLPSKVLTSASSPLALPASQA
ncbi:malate dehydrogenase [Agrobacterium tumefaciens]|nr:malate dehydrogenase [Agrobacterium tumefaciens]